MLLLSYIYPTFRTFRELSKAEDQLSLCRELCEDLADDLKKEDMKVGCSVLSACDLPQFVIRFVIRFRPQQDPVGEKVQHCIGFKRIEWSPVVAPH